MKVVLTRDAEADLLQIGDYIARDDPLRADSFIQELVDQAMQLGNSRTVSQWPSGMGGACGTGRTEDI